MSDCQHDFGEVDYGWCKNGCGTFGSTACFCEGLTTSHVHGNTFYVGADIFNGISYSMSVAFYGFVHPMCAKMGESSSAMDDFWRGVMERTQPQTRSAVMPNPYGGLTAQREYTASEIAHGKAIAKAIGGW